MRTFFFGLLQLIWFATTTVNAQQCDICGGNALPEPNFTLNIGDQTLAQCEASALDPTFCSLLGFFNGFTCGAAQTNPALAFEFCQEFQVTLGVACSCNVVTPITVPTAPVAAPVAAPTVAPVAPTPAVGFGILAAIRNFFASLFGA